MAGLGSQWPTGGRLCLMNSMARSVDADRDDLPGDLSSLYELMRRSTSAECGLAAKSRASATLNALQHSVLQTYWY